MEQRGIMYSWNDRAMPIVYKMYQVDGVGDCYCRQAEDLAEHSVCRHTSVEN